MICRYDRPPNNKENSYKNNRWSVKDDRPPNNSAYVYNKYAIWFSKAIFTMSLYMWDLWTNDKICSKINALPCECSCKFVASLQVELKPFLWRQYTPIFNTFPNQNIKLLTLRAIFTLKMTSWRAELARPFLCRISSSIIWINFQVSSPLQSQVSARYRQGCNMEIYVYI